MLTCEVAFPESLARLRRWLFWRIDRGRKLPCDHAGRPIDAHDVDQWETKPTHIPEACDGLAFAIHRRDGIVGIDLDDCRDADSGEWEPWADEIVDQLCRCGAYVEISPSGAGAKALVRGKWGDSLKSSVSVGGGAIEVYHQLRFFAMTGWEISRDGQLVDGQAVLDQLRERYDFSKRQPAAAPTPATLPGGSSGQGQYPAQDFDASATVADVVAMLQGAGWQLAGEHGGHHRLTRPGKDTGPSGSVWVGDEGGVLFKAWTSSTEFEQDKTYTASGVFAVIHCRGNWTEANRQLRAQGYGGEAAPADLGVDLSGIFNSPEPNEEAEQIEREMEAGRARAAEAASGGSLEQRPGETPQGLIERIVAYNLATSYAPNAYLAVSGAIALMATLASRRIRDEHDNRTNLIIVSLAPSGCGKEPPRRTNRLLLEHAMLSDWIGSERVSSPAGFVAELVESPIRLFQLDEFQGEVKHMARVNSPLAGLADTIKSVYSSAGSRSWRPNAYGDRRKNATVDQPAATLYCTGTPRFWDYVDEDMLTAGLIGRALLFEEDDAEPVEARPFADPPTELIEEIKQWANMPYAGLNQQPRVLLSTTEAAERMADHQVSIKRRRLDDVGPARDLWSRHSEKTAKLAMVFACSRLGVTGVEEGGRIELADVELAIAFNNWSTRRMILSSQPAPDTEFRRDCDRVRNVLASRGGWVNHTELMRGPLRHLRARQVEELLDTMVESQQIECRRIDTKGRPKRVYQASTL